MPTLREASLAAPREPRRDLALAVLLGGLSVGAWAALWAWSASPYARYAAHDGWLDSAAFAALCRSVPAGSFVVPAALYALAWVLMIAAMMLPTTYPVLGIFRVMTRSRADARALARSWSSPASSAPGSPSACSRMRSTARWPGSAAAAPGWSEHGWVAGVAVLASAGLFQFSALKYRCLEQCRTPFAFVASRWHGRAPAREAFGIGIDHGIFCVGCCWALMLCMFVVGTGSLGWMLALGALMATEKNVPGGARLRLPIGLGLSARRS